MKNIRRLMLMIVITGVIGTAIHEGSHLLGMRLVGIEGHILSTDLDAVHYLYHDAPAWKYGIVGISGGLGTALTYWILQKLEEMPEEDDAARRFWMFFHATYCIGEGLAQFTGVGFFQLWGAVAGLYIGLRQLLKYLS